jgi:hypothetical protein
VFGPIWHNGTFQTSNHFHLFISDGSLNQISTAQVSLTQVRLAFAGGIIISLVTKAVSIYLTATTSVCFVPTRRNTRIPR